MEEHNVDSFDGPMGWVAAKVMAYWNAVLLSASRNVMRWMCGFSSIGPPTHYRPATLPLPPTCNALDATLLQRGVAQPAACARFVDQKSSAFEPSKFEDHYETALIDLINQKRAGKTIGPMERPKGENVVDLMEALRRSVGGAATPETKTPKKGAKKTRKAAAAQKEMLMPIQGKKQEGNGREEADSASIRKIIACWP